jgi:serine/threonine-protein kinase
VSARPIALKIMHRELAGDGNLVARFRREGTVLRKLLNAHAVATYELGETIDGLPFIAMELLDGDTLLGTIRSAGGRLPWQRVFALARGVCSALDEAHGLGIIHRDLKPANIFVTANDHVKVLDFGIAKILASSEVSDPRELTIMGTAVGTLEYMAPEQLMGGKADPRTDIYTLGVVIYEVITGRRPFNAAGLELLTEQLSSEPPPVSSHVEVPPEVDRVLARCLAQDVDDRFASAMELSRALDETLLHAPPVAATAPPPPVQRIAPAPAFPSHAPAPTARAAVRTAPIRPLPSSRRIVVISVISVSLIAALLALVYSGVLSRL